MYPTSSSSVLRNKSLPAPPPPPIFGKGEKARKNTLFYITKDGPIFPNKTSLFSNYSKIAHTSLPVRKSNKNITTFFPLKRGKLCMRCMARKRGAFVSPFVFCCSRHLHIRRGRGKRSALHSHHITGDVSRIKKERGCTRKYE